MAKINVYVPDDLLARWREFSEDRPELSASGVFQRALIGVMRDDAGTSSSGAGVVEDQAGALV